MFEGVSTFPRVSAEELQTRWCSEYSSTRASRKHCAARPAAASADPVAPAEIQVVDGGTIRVAGEIFRLVGFDAPETYRARCAGERELGNRATFRLRQLIAGGASTWRWWSARARLGPRAP